MWNKKKAFPLKKDSTASELITRVQVNENSMDKEIVRLDQKYNVVRYTDDDASNEDVEALNNWLKKTKKIIFNASSQKKRPFLYVKSTILRIAP